MKRIYISGFDVFSDDAFIIGEKYKMLCLKYGFAGLYPLDSEEKPDSPDREYTKTEKAIHIFYKNLEMIEEADAVIANLNNFRGNCIDDGTAFEIGYAYARNKVIMGYTSDARELIQRIGGTKDANGYTVEDFGYPVNLMIACATIQIVEGDFEDCLEAIYEGKIKPFKLHSTN